MLTIVKGLFLHFKKHIRMQILEIELLSTLFKNYKEASLFGKWIVLKDIENLFDTYSTMCKVSEIGTSEQHRKIKKIEIGTGIKKILIWTQMHGNESTGTKAVFDFLNCMLNSSAKEMAIILKECTLVFIPMLNPDGAEVYTRVNANNIDLNRDAVAKKAKESNILRTILDNIKPQFCFNMHDQRTIFGVEGTSNSATISFLAPSEEETRSLTSGRIATMNVIVSMNKMLQNIIPNCVGRYTDEFYPTATGDNFQKLGYNTILIESGHYPGDYAREISRKFTFFSLLQGVYHIATSAVFTNYQDYFKIPNNNKLFYDVIHRHEPSKKDEAYQYEDCILENSLVSKLILIKDTDLKNKKGHYEIVFD